VRVEALVLVAGQEAVPGRVLASAVEPGQEAVRVVVLVQVQARRSGLVLAGPVLEQALEREPEPVQAAVGEQGPAQAVQVLEQASAQEQEQASAREQVLAPGVAQTQVPAQVPVPVQGWVSERAAAPAVLAESAAVAAVPVTV
jgi:hypothetical protein